MTCGPSTGGPPRAPRRHGAHLAPGTGPAAPDHRLDTGRTSAGRVRGVPRGARGRRGDGMRKARGELLLEVRRGCNEPMRRGVGELEACVGSVGLAHQVDVRISRGLQVDAARDQEIDGGADGLRPSGQRQKQQREACAKRHSRSTGTRETVRQVFAVVGAGSRQRPQQMRQDNAQLWRRALFRVRAGGASAGIGAAEVELAGARMANLCRPGGKHEVTIPPERLGQAVRCSVVGHSPRLGGVQMLSLSLNEQYWG